MIQNEMEYKFMLRVIDKIFDMDSKSTFYEIFNVLVSMVEEYEDKHYPIPIKESVVSDQISGSKFGNFSLASTPFYGKDGINHTKHSLLFEEYPLKEGEKTESLEDWLIKLGVIKSNCPQLENSGSSGDSSGSGCSIYFTKDGEPNDVVTYYHSKDSINLADLAMSPQDRKEFVKYWQENALMSLRKYNAVKLGCKLLPGGKKPEYKTQGSACFDICTSYPHSSCIMSGESLVFPTGIIFDIPEGYDMLIFGRSGHAFKHDISLSNCVAVIDWDFTEELKIKLRNDSSEPYYVQAGERIAQGMLIPKLKVEFEEVGDVPKKADRVGGLGSTGK